MTQMNLQALWLPLALVACGGQFPVVSTSAMTADLECPGCEADARGSAPKRAKGAFTCDFRIPGSFPWEALPFILERDRMYMAARPGLLHKHVSLRIPETGQDFPVGDRYLFDTEAHAQEYAEWVTNEYDLDDILFINRWYFTSRECHTWRVIGSRDFADIGTSQVVMRTERWKLPEGDHDAMLHARWKELERMAAGQQLTSVWLIYNRAERLASIVYYGGHVSPDPHKPDFKALLAIEQGPALGRLFDDQGWDKVLDRSQFVWTIWFPFVLGDRGEPSAWPNSPPLPQPYAGDGVCQVSRGEDSENAPTDCLPSCGNGVADPGEDTMNCPGDVRDF